MARLWRICWWVLAAAIAAGELLPVGSAPVGMVFALFDSDHVIHFAAYALLSSLPAVFEAQRRTLQYAFASFLLGAALELAQTLTPERHFELDDLAANGCGVIFGVLFGWSVQWCSASLLGWNSRGSQPR